MERDKVLWAIDCCMQDETEEFSPCDSCPMMDAGCDEGTMDFVAVPRCLMDEIVAKLKEGSEWSHVAYVRVLPRGPVQ